MFLPTSLTIEALSFSWRPKESASGVGTGSGEDGVLACVCKGVGGAGRSEDPSTLLLTALGDLGGITMGMGKGHFKGQTWPLCILPPAPDGLSPRKVLDWALAGSDILPCVVLFPFSSSKGEWTERNPANFPDWHDSLPQHRGAFSGPRTETAEELSPILPWWAVWLRGSRLLSLSPTGLL